MPFELLTSKLMPPRATGRDVVRERLIDRLIRTTESPVVVLSAAAGYGKTTALAQWAAAREQVGVAWLTVDRHDNDAVVFLTYLATALDSVEPIDPAVFEALASPGSSIEGRIVPRLAAALLAMQRPVVLALDDVHELKNPRCIDAIVALADHLADGSQIVISTRDAAALPLGRWRTRARCVELGTDDLRMDEPEARALLDMTPVSFADADVAELVERTEGWPAGLYLASLSAQRTGSAGESRALTGNDRFVVDFLHSELVARIAPDQLRFLMLSSLLDELSGPLCDAVLESTDSEAMLESLERSNRFVVAVGADRGRYHCHNLVREMLAVELAQSEPQLVAPLLGRAYKWCMAEGRTAEAVGYAQAAGDADRVAGAAQRAAIAMFRSGRGETAARWFMWMRDRTDIERYPEFATDAALFYAIGGHPTECDHWAAVAEHAGQSDPPPALNQMFAPLYALLNGYRVADGVERAWADATFAVEHLAPESPWHLPACFCLGLTELMRGDVETADDRFADVVEEARDTTTPETLPIVVPLALAERAAIAIAHEEWVRAHDFAELAVRAAHGSRLQDVPLNAFVFAVAARVAQHRADVAQASKMLAETQRHLPRLSYAIPVLGVQTHLALARTYLGLADHAGARTVLHEASSILRRRPDLGPLAAEAEELEAMLSSPGSYVVGASTLTPAELRVVPLLATHLGFKEIGERLFVSHHTVKSHALSIYRKLDATSRSEAVERAHEIGLL